MEKFKKRQERFAPAWFFNEIIYGSSEHDESCSAVDCKESGDEYEGNDRHQFDQDVDGRT